jgi:Icc-related predicted phosphoesterase
MQTMATRVRTTDPSKLRSHVEIVCISDTHELHRDLDVPRGDILIHAGDFTMFSKSAAAILDFNDWLGELPHLWKIVIPGNHEFFLESDPDKRKLISNATILINESVEIMDLKIWGSPTTPLYGGAFGLTSAADRAKLYAKTPSDVDILITHGPPYGILDRSPGMPNHSGCHPLLAAVTRLKPKLHIFGHVHGSHGTVSTEETLFVNAALLGLDGDLNESAIVLRMPRA